MHAKRWTVQIHITEDGDTTSARAVLSTGDRTYLAGAGHACRNPADPQVPEIGDELAAARALADLAGRLLAVGSEDIAQVSGPTSW
ncbi:dsRBD fold-containing protein [Streptosporangium sp. OZ121]|uniref:dsRBD fold-containing protein n=1 Tax=Streptosporangium sp. OZ121 TaxID=3444183 RepID=UPI003F7B29EA